MTFSRRRTREIAKNRNTRLSDVDELDGLHAEFRRTKDPRRPLSQPRSAKTHRPAIDWPEEFQLFQGLTCSITAELDLSLLVKTILNQAVATVGADRGILFLGRQDAGGLVPVFAINLSGEELQSVDRMSRTILAEGKKGRLVLTEDALSDPRVASIASVQANRMRSILCAPLVSASGQVGALYLDSARANAFPHGVLPLFEGLSRVAAVALQNAETHGALVRENTDLRSQESSSRAVDRLVGQSSAAENLRRQALAVSLLDQPLVIVGEPGSGRSHLAAIIHASSRRGRAPFVTCDCSVFSGSQLKKTLLGRTGAGPRGKEARETGLMGRADHGTLYVSNVDQLGEDARRALVRMVSAGTFRPLGARHDERLDVRLILAVSPQRSGEEPLPKAFLRVQPCQILVLPLREHPEDIPALLLHFLSNRASESPRKSLPTFTSQAIRLLKQQQWPGNVRELQQFAHRILLLSAHRTAVDVEEAKAALAAIETGTRDTMGPWSGTIRPLKEWEEEALRQALLHTQGNKMEAARLLGIHRNTMQLKLKALESGR